MDNKKTNKEIALEKAADMLYSIGLQHLWFETPAPPSWRDLDPIGRQGFLEITAAVIEAHNSTATPAVKKISQLHQETKQPRRQRQPRSP